MGSDNVSNHNGGEDTTHDNDPSNLGLFNFVLVGFAFISCGVIAFSANSKDHTP